MQKVNKIMKMTVAVLLSLTLVTSCIASGIFAKYVTAESALATVGIKAFGVEITAKVGDSVKAVVDPDPDDNAVTVTVSDLKIKPGDNFSDAIRFTITGTAEVSLQVKMTVKIQYGGGASADYNKFKYTDAKYYMPIGFTFEGLNSTSTAASPIPKFYVANPWRVRSSTSVSGSIASGATDIIGMNNTEDLIVNTLVDKLNASKVNTKTSDSTSTANEPYVYSNFAPKESIVFYAKGDTAKAKPMNTFVLGFDWPYEWPLNGTDAEKAKYDEVATWLSENANDEGESTVSVTYTVEVVQVENT